MGKKSTTREQEQVQEQEQEQVQEQTQEQEQTKEQFNLPRMTGFTDTARLDETEVPLPTKRRRRRRKSTIPDTGIDRPLAVETLKSFYTTIFGLIADKTKNSNWNLTESEATLLSDTTFNVIIAYVPEMDSKRTALMLWLSSLGLVILPRLASTSKPSQQGENNSK